MHFIMVDGKNFPDKLYDSKASLVHFFGLILPILLKNPKQLQIGYMLQ